MPLQEPSASTLSVGDIAAMSDAALAEFIQQHRGPDGNADLPVDGWDVLSKDERARLAERLVAQQQALAQSPTAHSQPLDLDQLDKRLRDVSKNGPSQAPRQRPPNRGSRSPTVFFDVEAAAKESETEAYNKLVKHGSRPLYPIALLDEVFRKPEEYSELLRPMEWFGPTGRHWRPAQGLPTGYGPLEGSDNGGSCREVFQRQWARWQNFGIWQRDNRWIEDDDDGFPSYVEYRKESVKKNLLIGRDVAKELADIDADPSILKGECWDEALWNRIEQQRCCRERHGGVEFADYVNAVKRRLARHGFARPFELKEDPKLQDHLSTWIEYLGFEYWWLDRYTDTIDRLKPDYDKAWQKLVDSKVLRPGETQEYISSYECAMRRDAEEDQAWHASEKAQANAKQVYHSTQLDPNRLSVPKAKRCEMLQAASHDLKTALSRRSSTKIRNNLIGEFVVATRSTRRAERDAAHHRVLLAWILEQIPSIADESGQTEAVQHGPDTAENTKKRLYPDEDNPLKPDTKRRKLSCSSLSLRPDTSAVHLSRTLATSEMTPQGLRRSARIAAQQMTAETAIVSQPSRRDLRPRQQNKCNQARGPLLAVESTCLSTTKSKDTKRDSRRNASKPPRVSGGSRRRRRRRRGA